MIRTCTTKENASILRSYSFYLIIRCEDPIVIAPFIIILSFNHFNFYYY